MGFEKPQIRGKSLLLSQQPAPNMTQAAKVTTSNLSYAVQLELPTLTPLNVLAFEQAFPQNWEPR